MAQAGLGGKALVKKKKKHASRIYGCVIRYSVIAQKLTDW